MINQSAVVLDVPPTYSTENQSGRLVFTWPNNVWRTIYYYIIDFGSWFLEEFYTPVVKDKIVPKEQDTKITQKKHT